MLVVCLLKEIIFALPLSRRLHPRPDRSRMLLQPVAGQFVISIACDKKRVVHHINTACPKAIQSC
jgi:hypothetical protein